MAPRTKLESLPEDLLFAILLEARDDEGWSSAQMAQLCRLSRTFYLPAKRLLYYGIQLFSDTARFSSAVPHERIELLSNAFKQDLTLAVLVRHLAIITSDDRAAYRSQATSAYEALLGILRPRTLTLQIPFSLYRVVLPWLRTEAVTYLRVHLGVGEPMMSREDIQPLLVQVAPRLRHLRFGFGRSSLTYGAVADIEPFPEFPELRQLDANHPLNYLQAHCLAELLIGATHWDFDTLVIGINPGLMVNTADQARITGETYRATDEVQAIISAAPRTTQDLTITVPSTWTSGAGTLFSDRQEDHRFPLNFFSSLQIRQNFPELAYLVIRDFPVHLVDTNARVRAMRDDLVAICEQSPPVQLFINEG